MPARGRLSAAALVAVAVLAACTSPDAPGPQTSPGRAAEPSDAAAGRSDGDVMRSACALGAPLLQRLRRGFYPGRSPDVVVVPDAPHFFGGFGTTTHSGPWGYLQRVPLVLYGPGFVRARGAVTLDRPVTLADVAPTIAALVGAPWPSSRPGRPLGEALVPAAERATPPRLVVVVVWDGGGWNVLERWGRAWPNLRGVARGGTSVRDATVGSSPSVTPAIHATIGTGAFPDRHGIVDIPLRDGSEMVGSWEGNRPSYLELPTVADIYDRSTGNDAQVAMIAEKGWHLGMLGHGALSRGGDRDVAVMGGLPGRLYTEPETYSLPAYLQDVPGFEDDVRTVDLEDGKLDSKWLGHASLENPEDTTITPVWSLYQNRLIEALIRREGYGADDVTDLLFTNYKQIDFIGHAYNMIEPEVGSAVRYSDRALGDLVAFLDEHVGRGRWVIAITADHGQTPSAESVSAWPINIDEMVADIARRFSVGAGDLVSDERPGALWLDHETLSTERITPEAVARFLLDYSIADNMTEGRAAPDLYRERGSERLFATAFPYRWVQGSWDCDAP
ncbi:MAG: alkaline phosphatase family protein [Actinomycetota bacterium]